MSDNYYVWVSFTKHSSAEQLVAGIASAATMEQKIALARRLGMQTQDDPLVPPQIGPFLMAAQGATTRLPVTFGITKEYGKQGWFDKQLNCITSPTFFPDTASAQLWFDKFGAEALDTKNAVVYFLAVISA